MSCVWVLQRGHGGDECDLAWTLCKYDLRKGDYNKVVWVSSPCRFGSWCV